MLSSHMVLHVHSAKDIPKMDLVGESDPYVRAEIISPNMERHKSLSELISHKISGSDIQ